MGGPPAPASGTSTSTSDPRPIFSSVPPTATGLFDLDHHGAEVSQHMGQDVAGDRRDRSMIRTSSSGHVGVASNAYGAIGGSRLSDQLD
jgi:hypothetical protein